MIGASTIMPIATMECGRNISLRHLEAAKSEAMSKSALYDRVALARDLNEHGLKRGDVATIVDTVPHPAGGPTGLVLEVTNALGESLQVVVVTPADMRQGYSISTPNDFIHAVDAIWRKLPSSK
jgi:hypothetical protein